MPSSFEILMTSNLSALYDAYGQAAVYTGPDGNVTNIRVRVQRHESHQVDRGGSAAGELQSGDLLVRQSELPRPVKGGRIVVESVEAWTIELLPILRNGEFNCSCTRTGVERLMPRRDIKNA